MGKFDRFCQSCGMPMDQDKGHGGTEKDGTKSTVYCSLCYQKGAFRDNFTKSKQMVKFVRQILKYQGMGYFKRWFFTSHISHLARWQ
jgi:hypothetical protein